MTSGLIDALKSNIAERNVVLVIGTGVSVAATGGAITASWAGLLRGGIDRAVTFGAGLPSGWKEHALDTLKYAEDNDYLSGILSLSDEITNALGGRDGGEFRSWLRNDIGSLKVSDSGQGKELIEAIGGLGLPITTTNYDGLIEEALARPTSTWTDSSTAQLIIQGTVSNIYHLHGYWDQPTSIVFGSMSYSKLINDHAATAVEHILAGGKSLLFIGCGAGLSDPNFEALRGWLDKTFPSSELRHYRLCLAQELDQLVESHKGERIVPISYGNSHETLTSFISSLAPGNDRAIAPVWTLGTTVQQRAVEAIYVRVRTEAVFAEHLANVETRGLSDILIPPVLLPVTQEQFVQSNDLDVAIRPKRCEPRQDVRDYSHILVAAEETTGLTSALEWLVAEANASNESLTPIIIDFRQLGAGHKPLERQIRRELRLAGADLHPADPLPRLAIAVDNITVRPDKIFSRVLTELKSDYCSFVVVGCRQGSEATILDRLNEAKISASLRYVGRLNIRDATRMATLIEPTRASRLASKAIAIAKREHLPRTPFTIGLLLCMLLNGEALLSTASATALLDAWVNLLLGRGDPHDDARFALDSREKSDILASLAERFVRSRTGSLSEPEAIQCLIEYFSEVGWTEDPIEVLGNFRSRYILAVRNGQVRFTQSSYLHLFAAKRAIESPDFRETLYEDPLYFSPIIRHYAALTRNDADVLLRVEHLLVPIDQASTPKTASFAEVSEDVDDISAKSIEDLMSQLSLSTRDNEQPEPRVEVHEKSSSDWEDALDRIEDADKDPFPLEDIEDAPAVVRVMAALTLVSNVLRDSELVKNLKLKERVLHRTLVIWGKFVELVGADEGYQRLASYLADELGKMLQMPDSRRAKFVEDFCDMAPVIMGLSGISATLSSRKLLRSLDACFSDKEFIGNAGTSVMGALMGFDMQEPGWTEYFLEVQRRHGRVKAVRVVLRRLAMMTYYETPLSEKDLAQLHEFLVSQYVQEIESGTPAERKRYEARISQELRKNRVIMSSRRSISGGDIAQVGIEVAAGEKEEELSSMTIRLEG